MDEVLIVGAGIGGLTLALTLRKAPPDAIPREIHERTGDRLFFISMND